jgi:transcriptional regulator with XRE-family HTH domain
MKMMDDAISHRIKMLRENLGLNQRDFSKLLSLSGGYISAVEVNLRKVNDRLIKLIVSEFGVNEDWLKTGTGGMFSAPSGDERSTRLLSLFNDLPPQYQDVVLGLIDLLRKADRE